MSTKTFKRTEFGWYVQVHKKHAGDPSCPSGGDHYIDVNLFDGCVGIKEAKCQRDLLTEAIDYAEGRAVAP